MNLNKTQLFRIYKNGGKIIFRNDKLALLLCLLIIAILSLNGISASDSCETSDIASDAESSSLSIDDNSIQSIEATENSQMSNGQTEIGIAKENENEESAQGNGISNNDCLSSGIDANEVSAEPSTITNTSSNTSTPSLLKTKITADSTSVVKERKLILRLSDSNSKSIKNKKISISIGKKNYSLTTDKYGRAMIKISLNTGKYTVKAKFAGDKEYEKSSRTFTMNVYKLKTEFTVPKTSIIRGQYFYGYLKDRNGNPLQSKTVTIKLEKKSYSKKTDKNGRFKLKINSNIGKYKIKLSYKGSNSYLKASKSLTIKSYNATTKISLSSKRIVRNKSLKLTLKYGSRTLANRKLTIIFNKKKYSRTTDKNGTVSFKISKPVGSYNIKVYFDGGKGFKKSSRSTRINILPNYTTIFISKNMTRHLNGNKTVKYYIKLTDLKGNPIAGETVTLKVKCNNFTSGSGIRITKKTIVLSSDNIVNKKVDKKRMNDMAKLLRAKGYKVIVSGIGPNYHVNSVKNYKNVCVFHLVGGIDSGMFVDMSHGYYQSYLKSNRNQFVLGCPEPPNIVNLANRTWLIRAHDDNYSPKSFKGLYFPGKYLNKKTHVNYVYGDDPEDLVKNFLKYAKKGKSYGMTHTLPGAYTTYKLKTSKNGYVHLDLPIGNHTVVSSFANKNKGYSCDRLTTWINVIK